VDHCAFAGLVIDALIDVARPDRWALPRQRQFGSEGRPESRTPSLAAAAQVTGGISVVQVIAGRLRAFPQDWPCSIDCRSRR